MSADGDHLEFRSAKNITFVDVHPMITHATNSIGAVVSGKKSFKDLANQNKLSILGDHVEFSIDTKNITFVEHHLLNIHAKLRKNW